MVQTKWDSHLNFMADKNLTRTEGKVYEEPYAVEWDPETLQPTLSVGAKEKERVIDVKESNLMLESLKLYLPIFQNILSAHIFNWNYAEH